MVDMKRVRVLVLFVAILGVCSLGLAQDWTLNWYSDFDISGLDFIYDSTWNFLAEGMPVYLMWAGVDGTPDGLNQYGSILGDDAVVIVDGWTHYGMALIGDVDLPMNPQGPGEFNYTNSLNGAFQGETLYAIAFDNPVAYRAGQQRFQGNGFFGLSPALYVPDGSPNQFVDFMNGGAPWITDQTLIPEPATMLLMGAGLAGVLAYRKRRMATAA